MALSAKKVLAASKQFTTETVEGAGALKGKNCTISSITDITGGHRVTFKWTLDNGTEQTDTMDVMDGSSPVVTITDITGGHKVEIGSESFNVMDGDTGNGVASVAKTDTSGLVDTYTMTFTNGDTFEYEVTNGSGGGGTSDYTDLTNKPQINGVTLIGNKSATDLGLVTASMLPVVPTDISAFNNDAGYITASSLPIVGKQDKILASAMTIGGQSITTVEGALGALNEVKADEDEVVDTLRDAEVIEGKNWLNPEWLNNASGCTVTPVYSNGKLIKYTLSDTVTTSYAINFAKRQTFDLILPVGETFIFSIGAILPSGFLVVGYTHPTTGAWTLFKSQTTDNLEFTVPAEAEGMAWNIQYAPGNNQTFNNLDIYPMLCTLEEWQKSHDYEPFYIPVKDAMLRRSEQRVLSAKNFAPNTSSGGTNRGITYTVDSKKIVTANGTATGGNSSLETYKGTLTPGYYIFSGGVSDDCRVGLRKSSDSSWIGDSTGNDVFVTIEENVSYTIFVWIKDGVTANNVVFKPMLRLASDPDDTYVPYAMTNRELTDEVTNAITLDSTNDLNDITRTGIYHFNTAPTNSPESKAHCMMIVSSRKENPIDLKQLVLSPQNTIYTRSHGGDGWTSWYKFTGTVVS